MLEIIALVMLTRKIGEMVEKKGYKSGGYKVLTVILWFGGEFAGAFMAVLATGGASDAQCMVYIVALIGASIGAGIAYAVANSLPASENAPISLEEAPKGGLGIAAPLLFFLWLATHILGAFAWNAVFSLIRPSDDTAFFFANIASLIASGLVIGVSQWFLLTLALPNASRLHLSGWILVTLIGPLIIASLFALVGRSLSGVMAFLVSIVSGAFIGGLQWIILQRYSRRAIWWIAATVVNALAIRLLLQSDLPFTNIFFALLLNIVQVLATSIAIVLILKPEKNTGGNAVAYSNAPAPRKTYRERDNRGTRHDTESKANAYWVTRVASPKKDPFVLYCFDTEKAARDALLALPCIHVAEDTGNLICTEILTFGYYQTKEGKYEAVICGGELSHELWEQTKKSFVTHGGRPCGQGELEPERSAHIVAKNPVLGQVTFIREEKVSQMGAMFTYRIYEAPNAASAQAFLEENPVTQRLLYLIVNTPEGTYCRDIDGMYTQ